MASNNVASEVNSINDHLATALASAVGSHDEAAKTTIVTLSGENNGATMEAAGDVEDLVVVEAGGDEDDEDESVVSVYANSNYQAVNNSVLVTGSCAVKDPGVHVVIVEHVDEIRDHDNDDHLFEEGEVAN